MKKIKFVNRESELKWLEEMYKKEGFKLVIIFGRRRVGKTELIKEFMKKKKHIYYLCDKSGTEKNVENFARIASVAFNDIPPKVSSFEDVFLYIKKRSESKIIICIDEFPYLIEKDSAIPSIFQRIVDEIINDTEIMLILCGSSMGMMYEHVISGKSPLYGRKKGMWEVKPLAFEDVCKFFPGMPLEKIIKIFSIFGNIPAYLKEVDQNLSLEENIIEKILKKGSPLYREPEILLLEEFKEPAPYQKILEAMAEEAKLSKIASKAGIEAKDMPKYLNKLLQLSIIRKEKPVTARNGKKSLYFINDNLFRFWFGFCSNNLSFLEDGREDYVFDKYIRGNLFKLFSAGFEDVCRELVAKKWEMAGRWWGFKRENGERKAVEIDIVALNEQSKEILFAECKWQNKVNAKKVCNELVENKIPYVQWYNNERKESIAIFAKSFKRKISEFEGRKVFCFDLRDIEQTLRKHLEVKQS